MAVCEYCSAEKGVDDRPLLRCSSCKQAFYCSLEHQKAHWKLHKFSCRNVLQEEKPIPLSHLLKLSEAQSAGDTATEETIIQNAAERDVQEIQGSSAAGSGTHGTSPLDGQGAKETEVMRSQAASSSGAGLAGQASSSNSSGTPTRSVNEVEKDAESASSSKLYNAQDLALPVGMRALPRGSMQISVKRLRGKEFEAPYVLDVEPSSTVADVKSKIKVKEGLAVDQQRLAHAGRSLEDQCTLSECNIKDGSTLSLFAKMRTVGAQADGCSAVASIRPAGKGGYPVRPT